MLQPQIPWSQEPGSPPTCSLNSKVMPQTPGMRRLSLGPANPPFLATRCDTALTLCHFSCVRGSLLGLVNRQAWAGGTRQDHKQHKKAPLPSPLGCFQLISQWDRGLGGTPLVALVDQPTLTT